MALSNWDTLAFVMGDTTPGASLAGSVTNHAGETVEIYKNWVNLIAPHEQRTLVYSGTLYWGHWKLDIRRGPQDGVFIIAWSYDYVSDKNIPYEESFTHRAYLVGCGVYGFDDNSEWTGVEPSSVDFLRHMAQEGNEYLAGTWSSDMFADIDWDEAVRVNQGDLFIANHLNLDVPISAPGDSDDPLLLQALADPSDAGESQ